MWILFSVFFLVQGNMSAEKVWTMVTNDQTRVVMNNVAALMAGDDKQTFSVIVYEGSSIHNVTSVTFEEIEVESTGLKKNPTESLATYPHCIGGTITLANLKVGQTVTIMNKAGIVVYKTQADDANMSIDVSGLTPEVYIMTIGNKSVKFIKK